MLFVAVIMTAQTNYYMVVDKTDGTKVTIPTSSISQVSFQQDGGGGGGDAGAYQGAKRVFGDALLKNIYNETDNINAAWTFDNNGFPTKITSTSPTRTLQIIPTYSDGTVIYKSYIGDTFVGQYVVTIGSNGYASKIELIDDKGNPESCTLTYNNDEQLSTITWGTSDVIQFTYSDGDVIRIQDNSTIIDVTYETPTQSKKANTSNFILWDDMLSVDMDDLQQLHFAGILGKAPKHLPLSYVKNSTTYTNHYEFDSNGRVTMFTKTRDTYSYDVFRITW